MAFRKGASALPAFPVAARDRQIRATRGRVKRGTSFSLNRARFERSDVNNEEIMESGIEILFKDTFSSQISHQDLDPQLTRMSPKRLWISQSTLGPLHYQKNSIQTSCIMWPKVFPVAALSHLKHFWSFTKLLLQVKFQRCHIKRIICQIESLF